MIRIRRGCFLLLLGMSLIVTSCVSGDEPVEVCEYVRVGDSLPQLSLTLLDGTVVKNDCWAGKRLVLILFSTGCPDCQKELPEIEYFYQKTKDQTNIHTLGISRENGPEVVKKYWEEHHLTFPCSPQKDRDVYNLFASAIVPRIYVVNEQGIITHMYDDSNMPLADTLLEAVR